MQRPERLLPNCQRAAVERLRFRIPLLQPANLRQIVETVNGQLVEQFTIQLHHAHTFVGLCTRLLTKLTAHTLCIYLNRLLGIADFLRLKTLAFPI